MFVVCCFFFFKQKTAYEMRISDWSSDVCSSDLAYRRADPSSDRRDDTRESQIDLGGFKRSTRGSNIGDRFSLRGKGIVGILAEIGRASCRARVCQYG